jgi:hypothetical protein
VKNENPMQQARVFEETYQHYLAEIREIDFLAKANLLGVVREDDQLLIPLYNTVYRFSLDGIEGPDATPVIPAVRVILCKYILTCPMQLPPLLDTLKTYREFKDAGPLTSYFATNTNKIIETTFSGNLEGLRLKAERIGGTAQHSQSYDFSVQFHALPRIPVLLNFNDRDEMFPATCSILYKASAECFLDMECLAMTGTLLTGKLIRPEARKA